MKVTRSLMRKSSRLQKVSMKFLMVFIPSMMKVLKRSASKPKTQKKLSLRIMRVKTSKLLPKWMSLKQSSPKRSKILDLQSRSSGRPTRLNKKIL